MSQRQRPDDLRGFGALIAFACLLMGGGRLVGEAGLTWTTWWIGSAVLVLGASLVLPGALGPFHWLWMRLGEGLGWVNTRLLLGLFYYAVLWPSAVAYRLVAGDPLVRRFKDPGDATAWVARPEAPRDRASYLRPF